MEVVADAVGKGAHDEVLLLCGVAVEEDVVDVALFPEEVAVDLEVAKLLGLGTGCDPIFGVRESSTDTIQHESFLGRGRSCKVFGTCWVHWEERWVIISALDQ